MNWNIDDQDFNTPGVGPGRIVVALADGHTLSIITPERDNYLRESQGWSPTGTSWEIVDTQADPGNYEVALMEDGYYYAARMDPEPEGWADHAANLDGWIYRNVTGDMINQVVADRGLA